ncbi:MAG: matrixin family metalloprotease [Thermoanaerobaculia bacterium]
MGEAACRPAARRRARAARGLAFVLSSFLLALAGVFGPNPLAAHVAKVNLPDLAASSPHIVVAVVENRESRWNAQHTLLFTQYTLRVEERLRGDAPDRVSISVPGGALGNISDETCVTVHLEPGATYLLFLGPLDEPSLTPVVGAWQGMFREIPGVGAAAGESRQPIVLDGRPVQFRDLVAAVRPLAAKAFVVARPAPPPAAHLPVKTWDPAARPLPEKFVYQELAQPPIVINPLLADSPFSPWDQAEMAYWNLYGGDVFRVSSPSPTWSYGNGVFDIGGFPGDAQLRTNFDVVWGDLPPGVLAFTMARRVDGAITEADIVFNPNKHWTLDALEGTSQGGAFPFKDVVLHELGHVWGLLHAWEYGPVSWDSIMNYRAKPYYATELYADDTAAVRAAFPPGVALRDGLISSYTTFYDDFRQLPEYTPVRPAVSTVRAGKSFNLTGSIKIENPGTVPLTRPTVEVYLAPARLSFGGAVLVKRVVFAGTVKSGATQQINLGKITVPPATKAGTYFLAFFLRDPKDVYQDNNGAWSTEDVTLTVTRR